MSIYKARDMDSCRTKTEIMQYYVERVNLIRDLIRDLETDASILRADLKEEDRKQGTSEAFRTVRPLIYVSAVLRLTVTAAIRVSAKRFYDNYGPEGARNRQTQRRRVDMSR
jgi:hypothetical protein